MKHGVTWIFILLVVVGVYSAYGLFMFHQFPTEMPADGTAIRGTFGDMFGALNAFFSTLAFAGFIYTIILQRSDLKLQQQVQKDQMQELQLAREEAARQSAIQDEQRKLLNLQRVESTLFQLIRQIEDVKDELNNYDKALFKYVGNGNLFKSFMDSYDAQVKSGKSEQEAFGAVQNAYFQSVPLSHFVRTLLFTIQFIEQSEIAYQSKRVFGSLINMQLDHYAIRFVHLYLLVNINEELGLADLDGEFYNSLLFDYGIVVTDVDRSGYVSPLKYRIRPPKLPQI